MAPKATRNQNTRSERSRRALIEAATRSFAAYGFRRASMEGIAADAGVAKATAYAHFTNKEALFAAVVTEAGGAMLERAKAAAAREREPREAVLASLLAKHAAMRSLVHTSRHAGELLAATDESREAGSLHERYVASLTKLLVRAGERKKEARALARVLDRAAEGLSKAARDDADLEAMLRTLVGRVL